MEDHEDQFDQPGFTPHASLQGFPHVPHPKRENFSDPPQPPKDQDEPVPPLKGVEPFISPEEIAKGFMGDVRIQFLKLLTTEQAFQLLADLNRDLNEALAREIEEQTSKVSEAQQKLDRLSGLKYNLINR